MMIVVEPAVSRPKPATAPTFTAPLPAPRPQVEPPAAQQAPAPAPTPTPTIVPPAPAIEAGTPNLEASEAAACLRKLVEIGAQFSPTPSPEGNAQCRIVNPVRLDGISHDGRIIRLPDRPTLACSFALTFVTFARDVAAPMARGLANDTLVAFGTGNGFECRSRNRAAGAKMSAHGSGLAIDIAWFDLTTAGRISVERPATATAARFIDVVRKAGCGWFTTVLGPGSDAAHANHLHFDAERRGRDGLSRFCQ